MNKCELLAPAGSYEAVLAAINAGADAVYLGASMFSARAYAQNLTETEIIKAIKLCHINGNKVYLTLNTLLKSDELEQVVPMITPLYYSGLDGVIVQDLGVISILRYHFPDLELHASTQMSIMHSDGANVLKNFGFTRIVPSRELTLSEVSLIKQQSGLEIECFIHGAMCYSYSGLCLMSSMIGGRSGNRGRCAGTCRLPFSYKGNSEYEYPLSMKDMCTIEYLPKLIDAQIDSFKIEGRMKSPEYVAGVVALYRKYIDLYHESDKPYIVSDKDINMLRSLYIRKDICEGYYDGKKGRSLITMDLPGYIGSDEKIIKDIHEKYVKTPDKIKTDIYVYAHSNEPFVINMNADDSYVAVNGDIVDMAKNAPMTKEAITKQILKLGDTPFSAGVITLDIGDDIFIPNGALNEYRRNCINELIKDISIKKGINPEKGIYYAPKREDDYSEIEVLDDKFIDVYVYTREQLLAASRYGVDRIYIEHNLFDKLDIEDLNNTYKYVKEIFISLPVIYRNIYKEVFDKFEFKIKNILINNPNLIMGILAHDLDEIGFCKDRFSNLKIISDSSVYTYNKEATKLLDSMNIAYESTLPLELTLHDLYEVSTALDYRNIDSTLIVYGFIPLMITAGCLKNTYFECNHIPEISESNYIRDRKGSDFYFYNDCVVCTNIIFNDRPLFLLNMYSKIEKIPCKRFRIDLVYEDETKSNAILDAFILAKTNGEDFIKKTEEYHRLFDDLQYTTGHIKRGVE